MGDHSNHAEEIVECIVESCCILETPLTKKIARVYLISDILHNSSAKVAKASFFRKHFESKLEQVMVALHKCHRNIQSRMRSEQFKQKVLMCFRVWDDWAVYPDKFLIHLQNTFLGLVKIEGIDDDESEIDGVPASVEETSSAVANDDDDEVDGIPFDNDITNDDDVDGIPLDTSGQDATEAVKEEPKHDPPGFIQSKWETIDKETVEQQAMTTSKWELLNQDTDQEEDDDDVDGVEIEETEIKQPPPKQVAPESSKPIQSATNMEYDAAARARLREVEVKVMKFQDEIEAGRKKLKEGQNMQEALKEYREKLLEKDAEKEAKKKGRDKDKKEKDRKRKRSRSSSSDN